MAGRTLISAGVLLLLFVAYELWGTNISEARSQTSLAHQWQTARAHTPKPAAGTTATTVASTPALPGYAIGIIQIPKIGVQKYLVQGVGETDLMKGPGHYPGTPMPGQPGNVAIAGHRTTYGAPFYNLDQLAPGDKIVVETLAKDFTYVVTGSQVVSPNDVSVIQPRAGYNLTLTTCNPRFSASQRLIIEAALAGASRTAAPAAVAPPAPGTSKSLSGDTISGPAQNSTSGSSAAIPDVVGWGLGAAALWLAAWLVARRLKPRLPWGWPAYVAGAPVFLVLLYFFFENVTRLLPSNV